MSKEEILDIIIDLYEEFKISDFGFDLITLIKNMGINLIPYSCYDLDIQKILIKYDEDGFNIINPKNNRIEIFYNDQIIPKRRLKFTLPHEIGHIVLGHNCKNEIETPQKKWEANLFANEFYCPQAFMIHYNLLTRSDLISTFDISGGYADTLLSKLSKRQNRSLSENEKRLILTFEKNKKD